MAAFVCGTLAMVATAAEAARKPFDVPAGAAPSTLKQFSAQAGGHLLYSADAVAGVTTNAVKGEFMPHQALDQMLDGTGLVGRRDAATGALSVTRRNGARLSNSAVTRSAAAHEGGGNGSSAAATDGKSDVVELSPFSVNSDRDRGFVAASALAGGRLSTDLRDTPAAYSVLTRDFIEALQITNLTMAQQWTTGFNEIEDDGRQNQFGDGERGRRTFRGVSSNQQQIEFFPAYYDYDSYNLERFDFARGPNSILFGSGSMGGTANGLFKRANTSKQSGELSIALSSWDSFRATVDLNQPITPKLAVRFNGLWEDANTWRDTEYYNRRAATITGTYRPWRGGNFRVTAES
jgi:outer membrane receptor for ferric coprogen and ferric-rhodotorulic acid